MPARLDDPLTSEQAYLARARAELERMRQHTLSLTVEGLDPTWSQNVAQALYLRALALVDDPSTTLFFGRTDHEDGARWYIGRRHVADEAGDPVVLDWRADVARAFYRASRTEPLSVTRRRRFGVERGAITAFEDEFLTGTTETSTIETSTSSRILAQEIERPRIGPMRDIVATIQPEQDVIVRADVGLSVCIQGAPGTGKTAVGLHRAAWLLYAHRAQLERSGVLVVGPNESFLDHINAILPSLGEAAVRHATVESLVTSGPDGAQRYRIRGQDAVPVAQLKGDIRMAQVLHRAVWAGILTPSEPLVLPRGIQRWRVPAYVAAGIVDELRTRGVRYHAARDLLPQRLAHQILVKMEDAGDSPDDRVQDAVARSREVRRYVDAVWPAADPKVVLWRLFSDPVALAQAAEGILDDAEQQALRWPAPPKSAGAAKWTAADAVLLDELDDVLLRPRSLGHVVLDEAQDLSPMQLRAVGRRCASGSMTVLGDIAQGTTPWATASWTETMQHLGQPGAALDVLERGFRVPAAVIGYAARLLPVIAPGLGTPTSVRDNPGSLRLTTAGSEADLWTGLLDAVRLALAEEGSIGVIVPDAWRARATRNLSAAGIAADQLGAPSEPAGEGVSEPARVSVIGATTAKGLEYDRVIVLEPAAIAAAEPDERTGLRRLYVVLTRAVTALTVIHHRPLPTPLAEP
jgi:DNA helicase IV